LAIASGEALVSLGLRKGLVILEKISHNKAVTERLRARADEYAEMLRKAVAGTAKADAQQP